MCRYNATASHTLIMNGTPEVYRSTTESGSPGILSPFLGKGEGVAVGHGVATCSFPSLEGSVNLLG